MVRRFFKIFLFLLIFPVMASVLFHCNEDPFQDEIPFVFVDETINLNNFEYSPLNQIGGFVYIEGGVRGIIIYRQSEDRYLAFERNCPYQPYDECAQVEVDQSTLFMIDPCCSSTFDFDGYPTGGPAKFPLRQYTTFVNQNFLTISSEFN
jgi:nitrite reductase/ring-hydroxylating ferredoxin subunit